jgi:UDP-glucose 4-epimerase
MQLKNKKILVTGGAGFIPSHIVDLLLRKGARVTVIDNMHAGNMSNLQDALPEIEFLSLDIREYEKVKRVVKKQDIIFHLAANADVPYSVDHPAYDFETNAVGGFNLLNSCLKTNVQRVIYASTAAVYGNAQYTPIDEGHAINPTSPYGASKLATEKLGLAYLKTYGLPFTIIRVFNIYGERQPRYVMYDLLRKLYQDSNELEVLGTGEQIRDYCYVSDAARCFILAGESEKAAGEIFNLAGGNPVSIKELVTILLETLGLPNTKIRFTGKSWKGDIEKLVADTQKAEMMLGFKPEVTLRSGVKKLHEWLKRQQ